MNYKSLHSYLYPMKSACCVSRSCFLGEQCKPCLLSALACEPLLSTNSSFNPFLVNFFIGNVNICIFIGFTKNIYLP